MATTRLVIEYDGTSFAGWASQPGQSTVQGELERALAVLLGQPVMLTVAGRTDAGVHALAQVASYEGEPARLDGLNALLPPEITVLSAELAAEGFNARFDATSRAYCYRLLARQARPAIDAGRVLHCPFPLNVELLRQCASLLVGNHTFTAFTPVDTYHVRFDRDVYTAAWEDRGGGDLRFWIEADTFMRNMNRVLVGTMLEVARGRRSLGNFEALLSGAPRTAAGPTAAGRGLYLAGVGYGGERVLTLTPSGELDVRGDRRLPG